MTNKKLLALLAVSAIALATATTAQADTGAQSPWQLRVRAIDVSPDESSTTSNGGEITADSAVVPELDISYFFTDNISAELILATSRPS